MTHFENLLCRNILFIYFRNCVTSDDQESMTCLHEFSNITQIMKVVLQYRDVHWLPVTHFTQIMVALGVSIFFKLHENMIFLQSMIPWRQIPNVPNTLTGFL